MDEIIYELYHEQKNTVVRTVAYYKITLKSKGFKKNYKQIFQTFDDNVMYLIF